MGGFDQKALERSYRSRRSNAIGQQFEQDIKLACKIYRREGRAEVDKTPEPFKVLTKNSGGMFTGRFCRNQKAQPDFQGTLNGGKSIVFEAKYTSKDRIQENVLTETQKELLLRHQNMGAYAMVCIGIQEEFFFIPYSVWMNMKNIYGRKYIKPEDVCEYKIRYMGALMFLDYINQSIKF